MNDRMSSQPGTPALARLPKRFLPAAAVVYASLCLACCFLWLYSSYGSVKNVHGPTMALNLTRAPDIDRSSSAVLIIRVPRACLTFAGRPAGISGTFPES